MIGIYKITNVLNNQCYIGQSIDIESRWLQHTYEGTKGKCKNKLYSAMRKYNIENFIFEVIEECKLNQTVLDNKERYWIKYYDSYNNGYNSTLGGQGENSWTYDPNLIRQLWDQGYSTGTIAKIVGCGHTTVNNRLQNYNDFNTFTSHQRSCGSQARNKAYIQVHHNYYFTDAQKEYFTEAIAIHQYSLDGEYLASFPSLSFAARHLGKMNPGAENGISHMLHNRDNRKTAYGYQWSYEKVDKMQPVSAHGAKLIQCIETGEIFHKARDAADWCDLKSRSGVRECCVGKVKSAGKHPQTGQKLHWRYID